MMRVQMKDGNLKEVNVCYAMRLIACGKAVPAPKAIPKAKAKGEANGT